MKFKIRDRNHIVFPKIAFQILLSNHRPTLNCLTLIVSFDDEQCLSILKDRNEKKLQIFFKTRTNLQIIRLNGLTNLTKLYHL